MLPLTRASHFGTIFFEPQANDSSSGSYVVLTNGAFKQFLGENMERHQENTKGRGRPQIGKPWGNHRILFHGSQPSFFGHLGILDRGNADFLLVLLSNQPKTGMTFRTGPWWTSFVWRLMSIFYSTSRFIAKWGSTTTWAYWHRCPL